MPRSIAWWPTCFVLAVAVVTDLRSRRIPNWLVLPFLLAGIAVCTWQRGWRGAEQSFLGAALGGFLLGVFFLMGGMGAGDVKLCAAVGAWLGPKQLFLAVVLTSLAGGLMALGWAASGGFLGELLRKTGSLFLGRRRAETRQEPEIAPEPASARKMPYAPAIAIGTLISFFAH